MFEFKSDPDERYFDEKSIKKDSWLVSKISSALDISEFRLFEVSYERWFNQKARSETIEHHFVEYMFNNIVPAWVRSFCDQVYKKIQDTDFCPEQFGIHKRRIKVSEEVRRLKISFALFFTSGIMLTITNHVLPFVDGLNECNLFPPCL